MHDNNLYNIDNNNSLPSSSCPPSWEPMYLKMYQSDIDVTLLILQILGFLFTIATTCMVMNHRKHYERSSLQKLDTIGGELVMPRRTMHILRIIALPAIFAFFSLVTLFFPQMTQVSYSFVTIASVVCLYSFTAYLHITSGYHLGLAVNKKGNGWLQRHKPNRVYCKMPLCLFAVLFRYANKRRIYKKDLIFINRLIGQYIIITPFVAFLETYIYSRVSSSVYASSISTACQVVDIISKVLMVYGVGCLCGQVQFAKPFRFSFNNNNNNGKDDEEDIMILNERRQFWRKARYLRVFLVLPLKIHNILERVPGLNDTKWILKNGYVINATIKIQIYSAFIIIILSFFLCLYGIYYAFPIMTMNDGYYGDSNIEADKKQLSEHRAMIYERCKQMNITELNDIVFRLQWILDNRIEQEQKQKRNDSNKSGITNNNNNMMLEQPLVSKIAHAKHDNNTIILQQKQQQQKEIEMEVMKITDDYC